MTFSLVAVSNTISRDTPAMWLAIEFNALAKAR